jgi:hypothetical protein
MRLRRLALAAVIAALLGLLGAWLAGRSGTPPARSAASTRAPAEPDAVAPRTGVAAPGEVPAVAPRLPVGAGVPGATPGPDDRGAFEGRVVSASDRHAIAGAEVVFALGGVASQARSGADGAFRFEPPLRGVWTLAAARAEGYLPFAPEWGTSPVLLDARPGGRVAGVEVRLEPAIPMQGEVRDAERRPVPGARVRLLGASAGDAALVALPGEWQADAAGLFTFVAPEGATLEARAPGFAAARARVDLAARVSRKVVLTLKAGEAAPLAAIEGVVKGPAGPIPGALVRAFDGGDAPVAEAVADAAGAFTLGGLSPGRHVLTASAPGYAPRTRWGYRAPSSGVEIELERGGRVAGRVVDARTGAPVVPFTLVAYEERGLSLDRVRALSVADAQGRFELDGLPTGDLVLVAASPSHAPSPQVEVEVPEPGAAPAEVEIALKPGGELAGRVVDRATRAAIAGAEVEVEGLLADGSVVPVRQRAETDGAGRFVVSGLPEGRNSLVASALGHHARVLSGLTVSEGSAARPVEIELTPVAPGEDPHLELGGIGAVLMPRSDSLVVGNVAPGSGAAEAGLTRGDRIVSVDGQAVASLGFNGAVQAIRGPEGSTVTLGIRRGDGAEQPIMVPRRLVQTD